MHRHLRYLLLCISLTFFGGSAFAQFTVTATDIVDACQGQDNGSVHIVIANPPGATSTDVVGPMQFDNLLDPEGDGHFLTGLPDGDYGVVVTSGPSFRITFFTIGDAPPLTFNPATVVVDNSVCTAIPGPNGSITLSVTGGVGPFHYTWMSDATTVGDVSTAANLAKGTYSVDITDEGSNCLLSGGPFTINDIGPLPFTISNADLTICVGEDFQLTIDATELMVGGAAVTYNVFDGGVIIATAGPDWPATGDGNPQTLSVSNLAQGTHTLYVEAKADLCGPPVQSTGSLIVIVNPLPAAPVVVTPVEYCEDDVAVPLTATGTNLLWYTTLVGATGIATPTPDTSTPGTVSYFVSQTDGNSCESLRAEIEVIVHAPPTITGVVDAEACFGATSAVLAYGPTTGSPNQYSIDFDGTAEGDDFVDVVNGSLSPPTAISIAIPPAAVAGTTYLATLTVRNSTTGCVSAVPVNIQVTVHANADLTPGTNPSVCAGVTTANLTYTLPIGGADEYFITFSGAAPGQGFADVGPLALAGSPIVIAVPAGAAPATYSATLRVSSSVTGCFTDHAISVTVLANPTMTLGADPVVCVGATVANLPYSATTADEYSLTFDATGLAEGFVTTGFLALAPSQIGIVVPFDAAPDVYNVVLTIRISGTGCTTVFNRTVTVNETPSITLDFNDPEVCQGTTSVDITYSGTTGTPDEYSIDFAGVVLADVVNQPLTASPITIVVPAGAAVGTYSGMLTVRIAATGCVSVNTPITVEVKSTPRATPGANPEVCSGDIDTEITYSITAGTPDEYSIEFDTDAETAGFVDVPLQGIVASPIPIDVPIAGAPGLYNAVLRFRDSGTDCFTDYAITVKINPLPTITGVVNAEACFGATSAVLAYGATTGIPDQYSIDFDGTAEGDDFVDVVNGSLSPPTAISIAIPPAAVAGTTYLATLTVRNSTTGCVSAVPVNIQVTINPNPDVTLGTNPSVCAGTTPADITFSAPTGGADQYSITWDVGTPFFVDVPLTALPGVSPISITVPGTATAATYDATLRIRNSVTGCFTDHAISVTVVANPTMTLGANPVVCFGASVANLTYSATTGDEYTLDFDATADAAGLDDVVGFTLLPASPIAIDLTGVAAAAVPYNAILTIRNSGTGCTSSFPVTITINETPTITGLTAPEACFSATSVDLAFTGTTGTPDQYSIDFASVFTDVVNQPLGASPIAIAIPVGAAVGVYTGTLTVRISATGCTSIDMPITVEVKSRPIVTVGANPEVCEGVTATSISYLVTAGTADQYSIDYTGGSFVDVGLTGIVSPIPIDIPVGTTPGLYTATLSFKDISTGCISDHAITVQVHPLPTISGVADAEVCFGATTANLTYTTTTDNPDRYSIDFSAAADLAGFIDVTDLAFAPPAAIVISIPGTATATTYTADLTVSSSVTGCAIGTAVPIQVIINPNPDVTVGPNPTVCAGTTPADLDFSAPTGGADQYSITWDVGTPFFVDVPMTALPGVSPISITVPGTATAATYDATLRISNSTTGCFTDHAISVTVNANPTITLGADPVVCFGASVANVTYSATTGDEYTLDFDATADAAGLDDVVAFTSLPSSPIAIDLTGVAAAAVPYNAILTIRNSGTGCTSSFPVTITINETPAIALDFNDPQTCEGGTSVDLTYSATTGTPNEYSINFDAVADLVFADVVNQPLTASPIAIAVPVGAAGGVYNAILTVRISTTGCTSINMPITVAVNSVATITLAANPTICEGVATADLPYTSTTGAPDQYTIDFDATASLAGFTDIGATALPLTPIGVPVPAGMPAGVYNASITVFNNTTGCTSVASVFTVTVGTDVTFGTISPVCMNTNAIIPYFGAYGSPDRFSIDYDAAAEAAGFIDVVDATLLPSNIDVIVPSGVSGIFNGILTVDNSTSGCVSGPKAFSIVVGTSIVVGPDPTMCIGDTTADLTYTATTGGPNKYSLDWDSAAEGVGFADVTNADNANLPASPLPLLVPGLVPVAVYNFTLTVRNTISGCVSPGIAMTLNVDASPTANAGSDQTVCAGNNYLLAGSSFISPASTGAWSITSQPAGGDGALSSTIQEADPSTVSFSATVIGDYVLTLTTDDPAGGCTPAQDDVTITIISTPVVATAQAKTICGNEDVAYEILLAPLNVPTGASFSWPDPDGAGPATAGVNVPAGAAGTVHINDRLINLGVADIQVTYVVTPSAGVCSGATENVVITVQPTPELQLLQAKTICSGDNVDYEILLEPINTPAGTKFSWPDPDGTGTGTSQLDVIADPTGTLHITDILYNGSGSDVHVIYSIIATAPNGCRAVPRDVDITVNSGAIVDAGAPQSMCSTGTATLTGSTIGGLATIGTWSIVTSPAGGDGALSLTTSTATPDVVTFTATVSGTYQLRLTTDDPAGSCVAAMDDVVITVRAVTDPACAGAGTGGTGTCANVVITPMPSPATCSNSDGSIVFNINPLVPAVNNTGVRIDIVGTSPTNLGISRTLFNDVTFVGLPFGGYDYTIEYGDPSCIKTGQVTIDRSGTVGLPVFSNPVDPLCFGVASGQVTIDVPGEAGNPLEWSIDGTTWTSFIAGNAITGLPGGTNTISVRRTSADACASGAVLTLADPTEITTTVTSAPATCANNDGSITMVPVTGGTGPYTYELNGLTVTPVSDVIGGLPAGSYTLIVYDANGCSKTFPTAITFPGFVNHTAPVVTAPGCTGGANGSIFAQIIDAGNFEFGITTDPIAEPASYNAVVGTDIVSPNLGNGVYFLWIKPTSGTRCATKINSVGVSGPYPVAQQATNTNLVCFSGKASIELTNIAGAPAIDYTYELTNTGTNAVTTGPITAGQALATFTLNNIDPGNYSVRILQDQSSIASCATPIASAPVLLTIDGPTAELDTLAVVRKDSYPDLATGLARVQIVASGMEPYQARMELKLPQIPGQEFIQDWTNVDFNQQTLQFEYTFENLYSGGYELKLTDAMGCEKTYDISISADPALMIPNIFTPNGDDVNETFYIRNLPANSKLVITNRWGKEVFQSNSYENNWNGGDIVDGVYFYQLILPDEAMTGWVEINRGL